MQKVFQQPSRSTRCPTAKLCARTLSLAMALVALSGAQVGARLSSQLSSAPLAAQTGLPAAQSSETVARLVVEGLELISRNDPSGAEAAFRKAIDIQPESEPAHHGLGLALWGERKGEAAIRELAIATRLDPKDADAHLALGQIAWWLSRQPGGAAHQAAARSSSPEEYQELAISEIAKAATLRPNDAPIHLTLAGAYLEAGRPQDALGEASEAVRLAPSAESHVMLGRAYLAEREEEKAAAEFQAALAMDAQNGDAHLELGQLRLLQRRWALAEEEFRQAIHVAPNSAPAYSALAEVFMTKGNAAQARPLLEKAIALDPQNWESKYRLAKLLIEAGQTSRARALLEEVTSLHPEFLPAREQMGLEIIRRGDLPAAIAQAEAVVALKPQAPEGHRLMALVLWKQRDYESSLAECALALAGDPDSAQMMALQSIDLWQLDRKKDAERTIVQAAKVLPKVASSEVFCHLVVCSQRDIGMVTDYLRKIRWVLAPPPSP